MAIQLQDSSNHIWRVGVTSGGQLTTSPSTGSAGKYFLRGTNGLVWKLGVNTRGMLTSTLASTFDQPQFVFIDINSPPSFAIQVDTLGRLQTRGGATVAWSPNGGGCSIDNSVVGGGGGFMSYPQPPQPLGFNPPNVSGSPDGGNSWNGQFQAFNGTFWNGIGNFFVISNPGRNTTTP